MNWQEEYQKKFISAAEAAELVKSGDRIAFSAGREAHAVGLAIAARKDELKGVKVFVPSPGYDFGWYDDGWQDSFEIAILMPTATCQEAIDARRVDISCYTMIPHVGIELMDNPDILLIEISPPDDKGFCSFGQSLWNKKEHIRQAKLVIAEVNNRLIRTYGDNFVHVSEMDYFVEHVFSGGTLATGSLAGRKIKELEPYIKDIAGYVSGLIRDGDTVQIGVGRTTEPLVSLGLFNNKHDLGYHSEATPRGIITLVKEGVINGKCKTINQGRAVVTSLGGGTVEEMEWANNNPLFELVDVAYLEDIRVIAAHDNMIAINNALMIDITGQIVAEGIGTRILSAAGGQIPFVIGALLSKGGRSVTVIPSTAQGGTVSRIMSILPQGTPITTLRNCADYVITEYGVARLRGKSLRQRREELIAITHPDFQAELRKEAKKLF